MTDPSTPSPGEVTELLDALRGGDRSAGDRLIPLVYDQLRRLAEHALHREHRPNSLAATDLVHEAYFKLARAPLDAASRGHFLGIAARAMRQVLVERARHHKAEKRGGVDQVSVTLTDAIAGRPIDFDELLALDAAIETLDPVQRQVVELRFFGGLEEAEIATALGTSVRTVRRHWVKARAWLHTTLAS